MANLGREERRILRRIDFGDFDNGRLQSRRTRKGIERWKLLLLLNNFQAAAAVQKFKRKKKRFLKPKVSQMHIFLSRRYIFKGEISFSSKREMWRGAILRISFNMWISTLFPFGGIFPRNPKPPGRKKQWGFYSFLKNSIKNLKMKKNDKKKNENLKKRDRGRVEITSFLPPRESRNHEIHVSFWSAINSVWDRS